MYTYKKQKFFIRVWALLLCVLMCMSLLPVAAFADGDYWYCPQCGRKNSGNYCPNDGTAKPADLGNTAAAGSQSSGQNLTVAVLSSGKAIQINGKSLVYHRDTQNAKCYLSYGSDNVALNDYDESGSPCYVAMDGSGSFVVYYNCNNGVTLTVPVVYKNGKLKAYSALSGSMLSTENIISFNKFYLNITGCALGCHESTISYNLTNKGPVAENGSYFEFMDSCSVVSKISLTMNTAKGTVSVPAGSVMQPFAVDTAKRQIYVWYNSQEGWFKCTESKYSDYCIGGKEAYECFDGLNYYG